MATNDETKISQDEVWEEHVRQVHVGGHWAYLLGVILGSWLLMVGLVALLGASGG